MTIHVRPPTGGSDFRPGIDRRSARSAGAAPRRAASAVLLFLILVVPAFAQPYYAVKDIGMLNGSSWIHPTCMNAAGTVAGWAPVAGTANQHAFIFRNGRMKDLGTLGGPNSYALGINRYGVVAGYSGTRSDPQRSRAFLHVNGRMKDLGTLGGTESVATAVNDFQEVTGRSLVAGDTAWHAFLWSNGKMRDLGALGGTNSGGVAINNAGEIAGNYQRVDGSRHAFLYSGGTAVDLDAGNADAATEATALNAWGEVTGRSLAGSDQVAFIHSGGETTALGSADQGTRSAGSGINRWGQVVGTGELKPGSGLYRAAIFCGAMHNLNDLVPDIGGWLLTEALEVNDSGQILAVGIRGIDGQHGFVLTPISESSLRRALGH